MFEKVDKFISNHYVVNNSNLDNLLIFEAELLKLNECQNENDLVKSLENLLVNVAEQFKLTENIASELKSIIFEDQQEIIEDPFYEINLIKNKIKKKIEITQSDEINLKASNLNFTSSFHFNVMLIYILSLETILKITSNLLEKNIKTDYLQNIFFTAIKIYLDAITFYSKDYLNFNLNNIYLDIPSDWIDSMNNKLSLLNSKDRNSFSFNLLISGIKINYYSCSAPPPALEKNEILNKDNSSSSTVKSSLKSNTENINSRKFSTLRSKPYINNNIIIRKFSTSIIHRGERKLKNNDQIIKSLTQDKIKDINYNKSNFSILEKIKELTKNKNYDPKKVQLAIENIWTDISKDKYKLNIYRTIQDLHPHIYQVFIMNDTSILKRVYPNLYLFLDDVRVFLITYNVITTYFRRSSRTTICTFVADQILFFVYKTYFLPIIQDDIKGKRVVNRKLNDLGKNEFTKENIFQSLSKAKRTKLINLIENPELTKKDFIIKYVKESELNLKKNKQELNTKFLTEIHFILTKIRIRKLEQEIVCDNKKLKQI